MIPKRIAKIEELLKREISSIIQQKMQDPRTEFVTVTKVRISKDIKAAIVWISPLAIDNKARQIAIDTLAHAHHFIQNILSHRVKLRYLPHLEFKLDNTIEYSSHINEVIGKLQEKEGRKETK